MPANREDDDKDIAKKLEGCMAEGIEEAYKGDFATKEEVRDAFLS